MMCYLLVQGVPAFLYQAKIRPTFQSGIIPWRASDFHSRTGQFQAVTTVPWAKFARQTLQRIFAFDLGKASGYKTASQASECSSAW